MNTLLSISDCRSFFNYLEYEKRYSRHTLLAYRNDISQFLDYITNVYEISDWNEIRHSIIRSWMVDLVEQGISSRSVNRKLSSLRALFLHLKKQKSIESNPMQKVIAPKIAKTLPETVQLKKIEKLFDTIELKGIFDFRNRLILELFYSTGMRRAELIQLKDKDVDFSLKQIRVLGKGNKERQIPVSEKLLDKLRRWISERDEYFGEASLPDKLFVTDKGKTIYPKWMYNMVQQYLSTVTSQKKRSPHVLRHSFATHLMDEGADLNAVKDLLGHANLSATQIYTHNSIEKLKNIYKFAHPKSQKKI